MSDTPRLGDEISNQTIVASTALCLIGSGCTLDWHCYWLGFMLAIIAFFGIIIMFGRYDSGKFK